MNDFFQRIKDLTDLSYAKGDDINKVMLSTTEELGEVAAGVKVDQGHKNKILDEPTTNECVDLAICALSIFFLSGGKIEDIVAVGNKKLTKWEENLFSPKADGTYFEFDPNKITERIKSLYGEKIKDVTLGTMISNVIKPKPTLLDIFIAKIISWNKN